MVILDYLHNYHNQFLILKFCYVFIKHTHLSNQEQHKQEKYNRTNIQFERIDLCLSHRNNDYIKERDLEVTLR